MDFVAIDFETANQSYASICQVGMVVFQDGQAIEEFETLVNPRDAFSPINVSIHGITESHVKRSPSFPKVYKTIRRLAAGQILVCHTSFDKSAMGQAIELHKLRPFSCTWLDTAQVARRVWDQFAQRGYGLNNVAEFLDLSFEHHNAKEDARIAGEILVRAISETGLDLPIWLHRANQPIGRLSKYPPHPSGHLFGERIVFSGKLSIPRREASARAATVGCEVCSSVNARITILVIGIQDLQKLAGHQKSSQHRRAEELISLGYPIRIIGENEFFSLIQT